MKPVCDVGLWINGKSVPGDETFHVIDPGRGEVFGSALRGFGREGGWESIAQYSRVKDVWVNL